MSGGVEGATSCVLVKGTANFIELLMQHVDHRETGPHISTYPYGYEFRRVLACLAICTQ